MKILICESLQVITYLLWYPFKGDTRDITSVGNNKNEISAYEDMRNNGSYSAVWRIFQFQMHEQYPKYMLLPIYLEENEQVLF